MKNKMLFALTTSLLLTGTQATLAGPSPRILYGSSKLKGYCVYTQARQKQKLMEFSFAQDPLGGTESWGQTVPAANARVTVEYQSNGNRTGPVKYYHARFFLHTFRGDSAELKDSKAFEYLDHEQQLSVVFETQSGVKIECEAQVLKVDDFA